MGSRLPRRKQAQWRAQLPIIAGQRSGEQLEPPSGDAARRMPDHGRAALLLYGVALVDMAASSLTFALTPGRVIELGGAFVRYRGGLTSADAVWRTLGRAHALRGLGERVLVLTSALPKHRSEFDLALRAAGPGALHDVIDVFDDEALARLTAYASGTAGQLPGFWYPEDLAD